MNTEPALSEVGDARMRRMAECWQASVPTDEEIASACRRLRQGRVASRRNPRRVLLMALVQGFVFGVGSLAAAAWAMNRVYPPHGRTELGQTLESSALSRLPNRVSIGKSASNPIGTSYAIPHAGLHDAEGQVPAASSAASGDPRAETEDLQPARERGHDSPAQDLRGAPAVEAGGPSANAHGVAPPPAVDSSPSDGPWAKVARALAASDWLRADQALKELSVSPDVQTRDASELARAQLWIAHGRADEARITVERLAQTAATPLVRKRAVALLEQLR